jgi:hypothetical protein
MKAYGGMDVEIHISLNSAPAGGEWSASRSGRFTAGEKPLVPIGYEVGRTVKDIALRCVHITRARARVTRYARE